METQVGVTVDAPDLDLVAGPVVEVVDAVALTSALGATCIDMRAVYSSLSLKSGSLAPTGSKRSLRSIWFCTIPLISG